LALLPPGGRILDAGCGSGRDSLAFMARGYRVLAIDGSPPMITATSAAGVPSNVLRLGGVGYHAEFGAVWGCASLLHFPRDRIRGVLEGLVRAICPGGWIYVSFRYGEGESVQDGRLFTNYTEESLRGLITSVPTLSVVRIWQTTDRRPTRSGTR